MNLEDLIVNTPFQKTDFGKLIIAKSYIKKLKCQIGQLESEVDHLNHIISQTKNIDKLIKQRAELMEWIEENRKDYQRELSFKERIKKLEKTISVLRKDKEELIIKLNRK